MFRLDPSAARPEDSSLTKMNAAEEAASKVKGENFVRWADKNIYIEEEIYQHLSQMTSFYSLMKILGLGETPSAVFRGKVSPRYKAYCGLLGLSSLVFAVMCLVQFFFPNTFHKRFMPDPNGTMFGLYRYVSPLWAILATYIRLVMPVILHSERFSRDIRESFILVYGNRHLRQHKVNITQHKCFILSTFIGIILSMIMALFSLRIFTDNAREPFAYWVLLQITLMTSACAYGAFYTISHTFSALLPFLRISSKVFQQAVDSMDMSTLNEAIQTHNICWRLLRAVDQLVRHLIGINLTVAVPLLAVIITNIDIIGSDFFSSFSILGWIFVCVTSMATTALAGSCINVEAHMPNEILAQTTRPNDEFHARAAVFCRRFRERQIGYTYFGFVTFHKTTVLATLNIATTYLIVAYQMKTSNPSCYNNGTN